MNKEIKAKWIAALRSGHYKQIRNKLRNDEGFCCLGVLCDVVDPTKWTKYGMYEDYTTNLSEAVISKAGIHYRNESYLISMNDHGSSFYEIADYIEAKL